MYEWEESLIEQAERTAAATTTGRAGVRDGAGDANAIPAVRRAIGLREAELSTLQQVYLSLRNQDPAGPQPARARREELLPRAWRALLRVESEKDSLLYDLYRLQDAAGRREER